MKKELLILIMLIILPLVSAINVNIQDNYKPGETLLGSLEGNFLSQLTPENFYFFSNHAQIPLIFDIAKIQSKYYFYAILPVEERNYTLLIKDVRYYENGREFLKDIEKNFTVSGNVSDFFVYPGFLIMKNSTQIYLESLSQPLVASVTLLDSTQTVQVPIAQKKKVYLEASVSNFTLANVQISALNTNYLIPIAILSGSPTKENITETEKFRFSKSDYDFSVYKQKETIFKIYLQNLGDKDIANITLNYSDTLQDTLDISQLEISSLAEQESKVITLAINAKTIKKFIGRIYATAENYSAESSIVITSFEENATLPEPFTPSNATEKPGCPDLNGVLCLENQECSGTFKDSIEGKCCTLGSCQEPKSYSGYVIGVILLIAVAAGLYYLYMRSRKAKISSEDVMKKTTDKFEERINPKEIRGSLSKD
jgi:hypothetical protein